MNENWRVWSTAADTEAVDKAIRQLYSDLGRTVAERRPVCNASGRCCKFDTYGHRLYVTGLEIAWFMLQVKDHAKNAERTAESHDLSLQQLAPATTHQRLATQDACPYQINGLCSTHSIRPLGCRAFFCEEGTEAWQQDTTERFLERLKQLHVEHNLPYAYMEWRAGLAEAGRVLHDSI